MTAPRHDWDAGNIGHIAEHGITPQEVEQALGNDPMYVDYDIVGDEERWTSLGHTNALRIIYVIYTVRGTLVRPVTAYDASRRDVKRYIKARRLAN